MKKLLSALAMLLSFVFLATACDPAVSSSVTESEPPLVSSDSPSSVIPEVSSPSSVESEPTESDDIISEEEYQQYVYPDWTKEIDWNRPLAQTVTVALYYFHHDMKTDMSLLQNETIVQIAPVSTRTYVLTESGRVFAQGSSQYHALAQETHEPIDRLVEITLPEKCKLIYAGEEGACAVGVSNNIYFWGRCFDMTYGGVNYDGNPPVCVEFDQPVKDIAFRMRKIVILTESGEVYAFGENLTAMEDWNAANGYEWDAKTWLVPKKIDLPEKVKQIGATLSSMFFLGESGVCYTAYDKNVTNYPSHALESNPYIRQIDFNQKIELIGMGDEILYAVTKDGKVYGAGNNVSESMGIGEKKDSANIDENYPKDVWVLKEFEQVPIPEPVVSIGTSKIFPTSFFLTDKGHIYASGQNYKDSLLTGRPVPSEEDWYTETISKPIKMQLPDGIKQMNGNGEANWLQYADGSIYASGIADYGNLLGVTISPANGDATIVRDPVKINLNFSESCVIRQ